ncbi:MAG: hypothetical protein Unbinned200contig1000_1 [Prokaryotic dsDNA virus sp.]|jgi:hypothetical protein|nr:hypothetical protein [Flavobacteriaceae bacterium]QDP65261.1 MAG: hypothetical protein Unbinned200contig1000_1 [Prokaryotic dsDNA virus sp.]|tara:strand:+ start:12389 stop:12763 length:375 start_codon:yes stop_codon:yes gene_type:complete
MWGNTERATAMDKRIINTIYGKQAMQLFVAAANLCLLVPTEEGPPSAPQIVPDTGNRLIYQAWGADPFNSGVGVYYSLAEDGRTVNMWDCEEQGYNVEELGVPLYTFPLEDFTYNVMRWAMGLA